MSASPLERIAFLSDVPLKIEVELDRKVLSLGEILQLTEGSVIRMTRSAGENLDILVGGAPAASGEIVIIEETVGVRLTDFNNES